MFETPPKEHIAAVYRASFRELKDILRSPGFWIACLGPFILAVVGFIAAVLIAANQGPRTIAVSSASSAFNQSDFVDRLNEEIGVLSAEDPQLVNIEAKLWEADEEYYGVLTVSETGDLSFDSAAVLSSSLRRVFERASLPGDVSGSLPSISYEKRSPSHPAQQGFAPIAALIFGSITALLCAAAAQTLITAYLTRPGDEESDLSPGDLLLSKLIGIGLGYSFLAVPWILLIGAIVVGGLNNPDPTAVDQTLEAIAVAAQPSRVLLFLLSAPAGYIIFASIILVIANRSSRPTTVRSLTGFVSAAAFAPAFIAYALHGSPTSLLNELAGWFPFTAPASIQYNFGFNSYAWLLLKAAALSMMAILVLRWAYTTARPMNGQKTVSAST